VPLLPPSGCHLHSRQFDDDCDSERGSDDHNDVDNCCDYDIGGSHTHRQHAADRWRRRRVAPVSCSRRSRRLLGPPAQICSSCRSCISTIRDALGQRVSGCASQSFCCIRRRPTRTTSRRRLFATPDQAAVEQQLRRRERRRAAVCGSVDSGARFWTSRARYRRRRHRSRNELWTFVKLRVMWFVVLVHVFNVCSRPSVRPSERFEFENLDNEPLPSIKSH
jgi:hypothetical protein